MTALNIRPTTAIKSVTLRNGTRLEYVEQGDPTGVPVVLLHGYSDSWHSYEPVLPYLPRSIRAFALTQRGHGDSDRPEAGYAPSDFAGDVAQFAEALGLGTVVVVGHSMGSTVAQQFAIDYPERTLGVVLLASFVDIAGNPGVDEMSSVVEALTDPVDQGFVREFQESTLAQPVPPEYLDLVVAESQKLPARVWKAILASLLATNLTEQLQEIAAPALVIWGDQDIFSPRSEQELLAAVIPDARLAIYEGAGHAMHWEEPARIAADIAAFVARIAGARS